MFKRILIPNRGEIALRIIRTLKEMGVESVVAYSEADGDSLPVKLADKSICIGPPEASKSYLNVHNILSACNIMDCDAVHPGYGFLAENASFAELCEELGIVFIGPPAKVISLMGDKVKARKLAASVGVSVIPGSLDPVSSLEEGMEIIQEIGFPVMLKAAAGGGGRGMRLVKNESEFEAAFRAAASEAQAAFGDARVYIEKFIENARHIEVQILADKFGNVVHLFERECSVQRRHQKLLEEAPAPIESCIRERIYRDAVKLAKAVGYVSAGTVEFLVDTEGNHYFIEMNTRIQVEHPVTEMITGVDIVKKMVEIAAGQPLGFSQDELKFQGWAMEFRINAEDPVNFTPSPGEVKRFVLPGGFGVRVDTACFQGYVIPPYYDSLLAKLIVFGNTREEAIVRGRRALEEFIVDGVKTTIPLHIEILTDEDFLKGNISVNWLEAKL